MNGGPESSSNLHARIHPVGLRRRFEGNDRINRGLFEEGMVNYSHWRRSRGLPIYESRPLTKEGADAIFESIGKGLLGGPSLAQDIAESRWDL